MGAHKSLMIYGATGYTGKLLSAEAVRRGLVPILAGRDNVRLQEVANSLGLKETRAFALDDPTAVRRGLDGIDCVLHAAGPFATTARPMMEACLDTSTHYLDITGELSTFELAEALDERAVAAGIMLMPGVGWDVIPSDAIGFHTAQRVQRPQSVKFFLKHFGGVSRGSIKSSGYIFAEGAKVRRAGEIVLKDDPQLLKVDFGAGPETMAPMAMGDLVTAWKSFRVPDIDVFLVAPDGDLAAVNIDDLPEGPSADERDAGTAKVIAEVTGADGSVARSMIETPSAYSYTSKSGIEVAARVLAGDLKTGFQSPVSAYGPDLALSVANSTIVDL